MKKLLSVLLSTVLIINLFFITVSAENFVTQIEAFTYKNYKIPAYDGDGYEILDNNVPHFTKTMLNQEIYEKYGDLDSLGRVTGCSANIDMSLMPTGDRESISSVTPTGWIQNKYDFISGKYLYNRSHLIGWQLTGENANKKNLMTGTRSFNTPNMLKFENLVADYIKLNSENNVLYRVTPVFQGNNLLATGVIMEAQSVDDNGKSIKFCVFVYNVENGVSIDYLTGKNKEADEPTDIKNTSVSVSSCTYTGKPLTPKVTVKYGNKILTVNTDYKTVFSNNTNAGTAKVTVKGINNYCGFVTKSFTIKKAAYSPTIASTKYVYDGKAHTISIKNIKPNSICKYKTSTNASYTTKKPTRTVVGKTPIYYTISNANYTTITSGRTVTIIPRNTTGFKLTAGKNSFTAKWNKYTTQTTGYQLRYSLYSNMSKATAVGIGSNTITSKAITKLAAKKKYYVQIRTFKKVGNENFFSNWSYIYNVTTR